jgi:hypothetical protein
MKAWIPSLLMIAGLCVHAQAHATCVYPKAPGATPNGATATKEEMVAANQDFKRYNSEMNGYLECIKLEIDSVTPKDPNKITADEKKRIEDQKKLLVQKNDAAVDELQAVVGRFNEQIRIYKARNQ